MCVRVYVRVCVCVYKESDTEKKKVKKNQKRMGKNYIYSQGRCYVHIYETVLFYCFFFIIVTVDVGLEKLSIYMPY